MGCNRITNCWVALLVLLLLTSSSLAVTKAHVISFGKWMPVQWMVGTNEDDKQVSIKIRALVVDARMREYVLGSPHEVTERLFVLRRVFRVNDALPEDAAPKWQWQRGGWLTVDRLTGRISAVNLPELDVVYSASSWHRDYVAYCGVSDDGKKTFAIVAQLNRKKLVLKKPLLRVLPEDAGPDSACSVPVWQRSPIRVSFEAPGSDKQTFAIRGHIADIVNDDEEDEEASK
jgi:hypothetical protein